MIIPSIDLINGQAVQLIGGEKKAIDAGDPRPIAEQFSLAGVLAVIDLDAALGRGNNDEVIGDLVKRYPCRVGGGIRDFDRAMRWLDAGARHVILGTAAKPELLSRLPRERVIAALDSKHGKIVIEGWQKSTEADVIQRIAELKDVVSGFLITFVEREGRMQGIDLDRASRVVEAAKGVRVTVAGGVSSAEEIAAIDRLGADVQVGMALYSGRMSLADGIAAPLRSDRPDGLWPTIVVDEFGRALGLTFSNIESVREAVRLKKGVYHSRSRGLWIKGATSNNTQDLLRIDLDCDRDALRFTVHQSGKGFCHNDTWTCWGDDRGLPRLERRLKERSIAAPADSYTKKLFEQPELLRAKLIEEATEFGDALLASSPDGEIIHEAADLFYFALTALARSRVSLAAVEEELDQRSRRVTRRPDKEKPCSRKST